FARALDAERIERRGGGDVVELDVWYVERGRNQVVGQRGGEQLALVVELELLVEGIADTLRDAAVDLPGQDQRIDDGATIVHDDVFADLDRHRLGIDLDDDGVHAAGGGPAGWTEITRRLEPGLGAGANRAAHRIGLDRQLGEPHRAARNAGDGNRAVGEL